MTRPWLLRRLVGDARRHGGVWLALAAAFGVVGFCAAGARLATRATMGEGPVEPPAHVIVSLKDDLGAAEVADLRRVLASLPGVEDVRAVSARDGLERLVRELGDRAAVLDGVGPDLMFPTLEIAARPASAASALAFRLRRLRGVADVDLVAAPPAPSGRAPHDVGLAFGARVAVLAGGAAALLALVAALALLRARLRPELAVLLTLGVTRATSVHPALALATVSAALGAALGLVGASSAARAWLGTGGLAAREGALGAMTLVVLAFVATLAVLRGSEAAGAR